MDFFGSALLSFSFPVCFCRNIKFLYRLGYQPEKTLFNLAMKKRLLVLLVGFFGWPGLLQAQDRDSAGVSQLSLPNLGKYYLQKRNLNFFERVVSFSTVSWVSLPYTDLGYKDGKSPYVLSADISPHFNIGGESTPVALQITPRYKVRILWNNEAKGDSSLPVRTPSYMPGASLYIPVSHSPFKKARNYTDARELEDGYRDLHYIGLSAFHHSNGQDGTEIRKDGKYNTYNGNFSTNFIELSYHYNIRRRLRKVSPIDCPNKPYPVGYFDYYGKIGLEQHFAATRGLRGRYSRTRLNLSFNWLKVDNYRFRVGKEKQQVGQCYRKERYRFEVNLTTNLERLDPSHNALYKKISVDFGYFKRILGGNTAAFIMAGYYGSDPYNVYFENSYPFIRGGLALGFFTLTNKTE